MSMFWAVEEYCTGIPVDQEFASMVPSEFSKQANGVISDSDL